VAFFCKASSDSWISSRLRYRYWLFFVSAWPIDLPRSLLGRASDRRFSSGQTLHLKVLALLPPLPLPFHVSRNLGMGQQLVLRVEAPAQFLFIGNQVMNSRMTGLADVDPLVHLSPVVPFLEPLVRMQSSGNEVMKVVGLLGLAEFAEHNRASR
jgi:hypothetical protein